MGKEWTTIETINSVKNTETKVEKIKRMQNFNKVIDNTKILSIKELKKHGDDLYANKKAVEDSILNAYNEKKLKSNKLKKQASRIKKERDKYNKNTKQNTRKVSDGKNKGSVTETTETPAL